MKFTMLGMSDSELQVISMQIGRESAVIYGKIVRPLLTGSQQLFQTAINITLL
jgi:hypothetical protein